MSPPARHQQHAQELGQPSSKRRAVMITTDLSDRHIQLCAQDAILAVQRRVVQLQMLDKETELHAFAPFAAVSSSSAPGAVSMLNSVSSSGGGGGASASTAHASAAAAAAAAGGSSCVLDRCTQRAFCEMLHGPLRRCSTRRPSAATISAHAA